MSYTFFKSGLDYPIVLVIVVAVLVFALSPL